MAQVSTIQPQISSIDAVWNLFQAQSKSVRQAFIHRLLKEESEPMCKECAKTTALDINQLDSLLYGSIRLPEDFDYEKEKNETLNSKYSF